MAWLVSEQGVEARSGHGSVTFSVRERRQPTRASFATLGQNERPCEKQDKAAA